MPTEKKIEAVKEIQEWMKDTSIIITTNYSGMAVGQMTALRRVMRESDVRYKVVKNTLTYLAADAANQPLLKEIVQGPTAIAFGYADPIEPARALSEYITSSRSALEILGALMDGRLLTAAEIDVLAKLPSKDVLIAQLMGQLQGPVAGLARVLSGPLTGFARVLQQHLENLAQQGSVETQNSTSEATESSAEAEDSPAEAEDSPAEEQEEAAEAADSSAEVEESTAEADDTPAEEEETSADAEDGAAEVEESSAEADDTPAEEQEQAAEADDSPAEEEESSAEAPDSAAETEEN